MGLGREGRIWSFHTTGLPVRPSCRFELVLWISSGLAGDSGRTSNSRSSPLRRSRNGTGDGRRLHQVPTPRAAHLQVPDLFERFNFLAQTHFRSTQLLSDSLSKSSIFSQPLFASRVAPACPWQSLPFPSLRTYAREFLHTQFKTQRRKAFRTLQWDPGRLFTGRRPGSH